MLRPFSPLAPAALLALAAALPARANPGERVKVAALEIKPERGVDAGVARLLDEVMLAQLSDAYEVLGKSDITSMLGFEQQKQMLGCSEEASCLAEVGGALGVDYIISGNLGQVGSLYLINLKLLDATKAKVVKRVSESIEAKEEKLIVGVKSAVARLMEAIEAARAAKAPPAPAPAMLVAQPTPSAGKAPEPPAVVAAAAPAAAAPPPALAAPPVAAAAPVAAATARPPAPRDRRTGLWTWVGLGGGLAVAAVGGYFGMEALSLSNDIEANARNVRADGSHISEDTWLRQDYSRAANLANVLVPVGLVGAAASLLFVRTSGSGGDEPRLVPAPLADGALLSVSGSLP